MSSQKSYKVIIIGAGVSGLSAANYLCKNGLDDILVLEAKEKAGGRIDTVTVGEPDKKIELGAQWIHGEENDFCRLVKSSNHRHQKTSWEGKGDFLLPNGKKANDKLVREILDWLEDTIEFVEETLSIEDYQVNPSKWEKRTSMGGFLKEKFLQYLKESGNCQKGSEEYELKMAVFQWGMSFQRIDNSCNQMSNVSLFRWSEFEVNPGEHYNNFKEGASAFINKILVKPLPVNSIRYNSPVTNIRWSTEEIKQKASPSIEVTLRNGETFTSDTVIITCSIGVLKETHAKLFTPELPSRIREAIESTGFGPIAKIFLKWEIPWWPVDGFQGFQFLWPGEFINCCDDINESDSGNQECIGKLRERWTKSITGFDPVLDNPNVLLGWLGGPEAVFVESESKNEVSERCAKLLKDFTGYDVPLPDDVIVSKWNTDEFIRGAYSFRSVVGDNILGDIASILSEPILSAHPDGNEEPTIIFAGEALSKAHYSTIHGAFESGESQAAKIIKYFHSQTNTQKLNNSTETADSPKSREETKKCLKMPQIISADSISLEDGKPLDINKDVCTFSTQFSTKIDVSS